MLLFVVRNKTSAKIVWKITHIGRYLWKVFIMANFSLFKFILGSTLLYFLFGQTFFFDTPILVRHSLTQLRMACCLPCKNSTSFLAQSKLQMRLFRHSTRFFSVQPYSRPLDVSVAYRFVFPPDLFTYNHIYTAPVTL